jgi:uncharacterized protein YndB with AHSA1/START domain
MGPILASIEIARRPEDVFAYVIDPARLPEWQATVLRAESSDAPVRVGTRARVTRRIGPREITSTAEIAELTPPMSWTVRGVDGAVRGDVKGTIDPLNDGTRSRVTIELEIYGHGMGKLLFPLFLFIRRKAEQEMPTNVQRLKERLERGA